MNLYRCSYEYASGPRAGERSRLTFAAEPGDALRLASALVRAYTGGYLLAVWEERRLVVDRPQLRLVP